MITIKHLAQDYMCIEERDMPKIAKKGRKKYRVIHDLAGDLGEAITCRIQVEDLGNREFIADCHTGTVYDPATMRAMTAPMRLE